MTDTTAPRTLTPADRQAIRERADKATPLPWEIEEMCRVRCGAGDTYSPDIFDRYCIPEKESIANLIFVSKARADVPDLLDALDLADARLERWRRVVEAAIRFDKESDTTFGTAWVALLRDLRDATKDLLASGDAEVSDG